MISFRRKWLCMIVALFFVFICTHTANAESGEITIPVPQESTEYADLESEEFILVMEESSGSYHIPAGVEGSTEVYAKLELQKRAEIWVDCYIGGGNSVSYDLLLADKETVVTSYTRTCNHMNDKKLLLGVLPAGTYYLRLHNLQVNNNDCAGYITSNFKTNHYEECDGVVDDDMSSSNDTRDTALTITESTQGYLSFLGDDLCDWYSFDVPEEGREFKLSMVREGCITYKLFKNGSETPESEDVIYGTTLWDSGFGASLDEGHYDLCVMFEDFGADAGFNTYNERGGLYDISLQSPESPADNTEEQGSGNDQEAVVDAGETPDTEIEFIPDPSEVTETTEETGETNTADTADTSEVPEVTDIPVDTAISSGAAASEAESSVYPKVGSTVKRSGQKYKVIKKASGSTKGTVAFLKSANKKTVTVPSTIKIKGKTYKVTQIRAGAFTGKSVRTIKIGKNVKTIKKNALKGSGATKLVIKTKLLKKANVKGCLKNSKVRTIQVQVSSSKTVNKNYVKKYKKYFTKKNCGRKVKVK